MNFFNFLNNLFFFNFLIISFEICHNTFIVLLMTLFSVLFGIFIWRYKIYIEGKTWSVSEKYILACNSMTLLLIPQYHDFFTRSLVPMQHYWPIKITNNTCRDIKLTVEWGNYHTDKVNLSYSLPLLTQPNLATSGHACVAALFS